MNNEFENSGSLKRKELGKERVSVPMVQWSKCHNTIQYGHNGYNTIQNGHNGGNAAIVTAVLGSVKMLSRPTLITRLHRNIRPFHHSQLVVTKFHSSKIPLLISSSLALGVIVSSHKNALNVKSLKILIPDNSQPWQQIKEVGCPVSPNFVYWFCCPYLYIELEADKIKR